jgi:tetratricopeptide (TPR) repeat protein
MISRVSTLLSATAVALALAASPAAALDTIIGGMASACARDAKAGNATPDTIGNCTVALLSEPLSLRDVAATRVNRGTLYLVTKDWQAAIRDFDVALKQQPKMGEAMVNRGAALIGMGQFAEAEREITEGLKYDPELPERAYYNRALARWRRDDVRGAYFDFQKALELKPGWSEATTQLAYFTVTRR